ncbi:hypothetical protein OROHE_014807 [Orobanche hederae]
MELGLMRSARPLCFYAEKRWVWIVNRTSIPQAAAATEVWCMAFGRFKFDASGVGLGSVIHFERISKPFNRNTYSRAKEFRPGLQQIAVKESDGALFVKTRKRKEGRGYMTAGKITKFIINKIEKVIGPDLSGPSEGVNELLLDGKAHGPSWLIGRCVNSGKCSTSGTIRQEVVDEMEEKLKKKVQEVDAQVNKKVQENLTWVLKKLGEVNPRININLVELCRTISSNNDNTPIIDGDATS